MTLLSKALPFAPLVLVLSAAPTSAQPASTRESQADAKKAREVLRSFGQCIVNSKGSRVLAAHVILEDVSNETIIKKYPGLVDPNCMPMGANTLTLPGDYIRYGIAEALVTRELVQPATSFDGVPLLQHKAVDPADFTAKPGASKKSIQTLEQARLNAEDRVFASKFGECVVRTDPAYSRKLLFTATSSLEEDAFFAALRPALGSCLIPGQTIKIEKSMVRGTIALNYYRLAHAAQTLTASQGASK